MVRDIYLSTAWKRVPAKKGWQPGSNVPMKQYRLFPHFRKDKAFRRLLRNRFLEKWDFAAHWVDSAEKVAFSIMRSWRKNYNNGERSRDCPQAERLFAQVKQTLSRLEGDRLRITIRPREYVWIDLSKRWFKLPSEMSRFGLGEPTITPQMIHLPIFRSDSVDSDTPEVVAWDSNFDSLDGFSPQTGWLKIDLKGLATMHDNMIAKKGSVRSRFGHSVKGNRIARKYKRREVNRARRHQIEIARVMRGTSKRIVIEALRKSKMFRGRHFNFRLANTDWRGIATLVGKRVEEIPPYGTSKNCSRCGWVNQDLKGAEVFECQRCGMRIDRQLNAGIGMYLLTEGVPYDRGWWDRNVLPALVGGYFQSGAQSKAIDELVRSLDETVKPQVEYSYDRYADAYLPRASAETRVRATSAIPIGIVH